jgi:hypothetical protein
VVEYFWFITAAGVGLVFLFSSRSRETVYLAGRSSDVPGLAKALTVVVAIFGQVLLLIFIPWDPFLAQISRPTPPRRRETAPPRVDGILDESLVNPDPDPGSVVSDPDRGSEAPCLGIKEKSDCGNLRCTRRVRHDPHSSVNSHYCTSHRAQGHARLEFWTARIHR